MNDDRIVEQRWVEVGARVMDQRVDTLREMADFRARLLSMGESKRPDRHRQEQAALLWAIAELSGIGEEVRRERSERDRATVGMVKKERKRAEAAEALNAQYRVTIAALKHELYRARCGESRPSVDAVDPQCGTSNA